MRLKWNANFQIEDSTIQLGEAYIRVVTFQNVNSKCKVEYMITDDAEQALAKYVRKTYERNFANEAEVYEELLTEYENSEIID
jgi:hypothetical protein